MKSNPCFNCGYNWCDEGDKYPTCHYEGPHEWSPCEADDEAERIAREREEYEEFVRGEMEYYD